MEASVTDDIELRGVCVDGYRRLDTDPLPLRVIASMWFAEPLATTNVELSHRVRQLERAQEAWQAESRALKRELLLTNQCYNKLMNKHDELLGKYNELQGLYHEDMKRLRRQRRALEQERDELQSRLLKYEGPSSHRGGQVDNTQLAPVSGRQFKFPIPSYPPVSYRSEQVQRSGGQLLVPSAPPTSRDASSPSRTSSTGMSSITIVIGVIIGDVHPRLREIHHTTWIGIIERHLNYD